MSSPYKLLVTDIDGTLINGRGSISARDKAALEEARGRGLVVSLSTGRALKACRRIVEELQLDRYHVSFDGALVSTSDLSSEVCSQPLGKDLVRDMVGFAHYLDVDLELYTASEYLKERQTWSTKAHEEFFSIDSSLVDFNGIWDRERIIKGALVVRNPDEGSRAGNFFAHFGERLHISEARTPAYPGVLFNNILAPSVSKGRAVVDLAAFLGIPMAEVMAVGDGSNDISLLSVAGLGVAMGNASDEVKAAADYVTTGVEQSGLAAAVDRFILRYS